MTALSDERAARWRELADAATPGPWWNDSHEIHAGDDEIAALSVWVGETCNIHDIDGSEANAAFIAAAREAVPALLAEREELRAENERLLSQRNAANIETYVANAEVDRLSGIVAAVEKLHLRCTHGPETAMRCETCEIAWPCPTWAALHPSETPSGGVVHACPPAGNALMPCCGRTPFERPGDRMTLDNGLVTCNRETPKEGER